MSRRRRQSINQNANKQVGTPPKHPRKIDSTQQNDELAEVVDEPEIDSVLQDFIQTREILGKHYIDVVDRLKLNWIPHCVQEQAYCKSHHHRNCPRPKVVDRVLSSTIGTFAKQGRVIHYLKSIEDLCIRMEFPGAKVVQRLMEMILTCKQPADSKYSTEYLIEYCVVVAETILMKFPPCWPDIKESYKKVFSGKIDLSKFYSCGGESEKGNIFSLLLNILSVTISSQCDAEMADNSTRTDSESESEAYDYTHWLQKQSKEADFIQHTRQEKLDRLFVVLGILTKILEYDLSIWLLRYVAKPEKQMFSKNAPLLAEIFFDGTYRQLTPVVKQVFDVFVTCACLQFPSDKVDILSRIISLLAVSIVSCEKQSTVEIRYPNIGIKAKDFAKEVFKTVLDKFGCEVDKILTVIKAIRVPFIKYLLIDQLLFKMNRDPGDMCPKKINDLFMKERWKCTEGFRQHDDGPSNQKYKMVSPRKRPKLDDIFMHEYLDIVLEALRAYCETYQLREVIRKVFIKIRSERDNSFRDSLGDTQEKIPRIDLDKIEADIGALEAKFKRNSKYVRFDNGNIPFSNIYLDGDLFKSEYRENVKFLGLLFKHIKELRKLESVANKDTFEEWYSFLNSMLSP